MALESSYGKNQAHDMSRMMMAALFSKCRI